MSVTFITMAIFFGTIYRFGSAAAWKFKAVFTVRWPLCYVPPIRAPYGVPFDGYVAALHDPVRWQANKGACRRGP